MTSIVASLTVGGALLYSSIKGIPVVSVLLGGPQSDGSTPGDALSKALAKAGIIIGGSNSASTVPTGANPPNDASSPSGVGTFDGKQVAKWIIPILQKARQSGLWHGSVLSGFRTPAYSLSLCRQMCGAPSCPGRCAGTDSNHSGTQAPHGAVDVSDPAGLTAALAHLNLSNQLKHTLSSDANHFSRTGS